MDKISREIKEFLVYGLILVSYKKRGLWLFKFGEDQSPASSFIPNAIVSDCMPCLFFSKLSVLLCSLLLTNGWSMGINKR